MHVSEDGTVTGSVDRAKLAELQGETEAEVEVEVEVEADEQSEDDLDELRAQAEALGIKVDGRWGVERLRQEIADEQEND